ncbi:MAG: hypothetical protein H0X27_00065 [Caulobacteraceae bacterium]|nr:hypothetical protein [Caulobacteraceae bacterium]
MNAVVAYLRNAPSEPKASEAALSEQRTALKQYLEETGSVMVAEFIEEASEETGEVFDEACHAVARLKATLVICSVQPVGSGKPLEHLTFPAFKEGYSLATGGPWADDIEPVVLGIPLSVAAAIGGEPEAQ